MESRIVSLNPDIVVFTETWLDECIPDNCISLSDFSVVRKDRNKYGGGVMMYISNSLDFQVINSESVNALVSCDSELLAVLFPFLKLVVIAVYHPFWRDSLRNERAISCRIDIINHVVSLLSLIHI